MPNTKPTECQHHAGQPLSHYCMTENVFGCSACFKDEHKSCDRGLIDALCETELISKDLTGMKLDSDKQKERSCSLRKAIQEYGQLNRNCYDKCIEDYDSFRQNIVDMLDHLGEVVSTEACKMNEENKAKLDKLSEDLSAIDRERESISAKIEQYQKTKSNSKLFISVKKTRENIKTNGDKLAQLKPAINIHSYRFDEDPGMRQILDEMTSSHAMKVLLGDVSSTGRYNVKSPDDKKDAAVAGMVEISPSLLVVADYANNCLKSVDIDKNEITQRRPLTSAPGDITVTTGSRVAVTLPEQQQIQLFSTINNLDPCGKVDVDGRCLAIESLAEQLLVSFRKPVKVEIMNLHGKILKSIVSAASGATLFDVPGFMSLSHDHPVIFISDWKRRMVTSMERGGLILWKYESNELDYPAGVVTGNNGCLYICDGSRHTIHVVSATGVRLRMISLKQFKIECPHALCSSKHHDSLYVSSLSSAADKCNFVSRLSL